MDFSEYSFTFPARIVEFDEANQLATVQISAERIYNDADVLNKLVERRPIEGVPVHTLSGGGWSVTMPIAVGDTCLIMFSQVGYDHWLYEDKDKAGLLAQLPKPQLRRMFSEDDGFCLVGFNTIKRAITNFSTSGVEIRDKDSNTIISLTGTTIDLKVSANTTPVGIEISATGVNILGVLTNNNIPVSRDTHIHTDSTGNPTGVAINP